MVIFLRVVERTFYIAYELHSILSILVIIVVTYYNISIIEVFLLCKRTIAAKKKP